MDGDMVRLLDAFASDVASLPAGAAPPALVAGTIDALEEALETAAGHPDEAPWVRLYAIAGDLVGYLDDTALPGLRAFLAENADLRGDGAELVSA